MSTPLDRRNSPVRNRRPWGPRSRRVAQLRAGRTPTQAATRTPTRNWTPTAPAYPEDRPRVILVRFGGGVRRLETIQDAAHTYCPFVYQLQGLHQTGSAACCSRTSI